MEYTHKNSNWSSSYYLQDFENPFDENSKSNQINQNDQQLI
jgi:hypothetical protein